MRLHVIFHCLVAWQNVFMWRRELCGKVAPFNLRPAVSKFTALQGTFKCNHMNGSLCFASSFVQFESINITNYGGLYFAYGAT